MKFLRWMLLVFFLLLIAGSVFRAQLFRHVIYYRSIGQRTEYQVRDTALSNFIERKAEHEKVAELADVIDLSMSATRHQLDFSTEKSENDPNKLIYTHTANCIGYAAFFSATCNYLLEKNKFSGWKASPHIGQLYLFGHNVHKYFSDPFFYDHDFVVIENIHSGEVYAVDPSMSDCLLIDYVTYKK